MDEDGARERDKREMRVEEEEDEEGEEEEGEMGRWMESRRAIKRGTPGETAAPPLYSGGAALGGH